MSILQQGPDRNGTLQSLPDRPVLQHGTAASSHDGLDHSLHYARVWPLPSCLSTDEREQFLQLFGAQHVVEGRSRGRGGVIMAGFSTAVDCRYAVSRLHQLQVLGTTLRATLYQPHKYNDNYKDCSGNSNKYIDSVSDSTSTSPAEVQLSRLHQLQDQLSDGSDALTSTTPAPHLKYLYPPPCPSTLANICTSLVAVPSLYTQLLHLMNKMNLPHPFGRRRPTTDCVRQAVKLTSHLGGDDDASDLLENKFVRGDKEIGDIGTSRRTQEENLGKFSENDKITGCFGESELIGDRRSNAEIERRLSLNKMGLAGEESTMPLHGPLTKSVQRVNTVLCRRCNQTCEEQTSGVGLRESLEKFAAYETSNLDMDNVTRVSDSSSSESELESENESDFIELKQSSLSIRQIQSMKRPRKPNISSNADTRKRARLQIQQERKVLPTSDVSNDNATKCKSHDQQSLRKAFKVPSVFGSVGKVQLIMPTSVGNISTLRVLNTTETNPPVDTDVISPAGPSAFTNTNNTSAVSEQLIVIGAQQSTKNTITTIVSSLSTSSQESSDDALPPTPSGFGVLPPLRPTEAIHKAVSSTRFISLEELESNRVKESEYPVVPVLAKYSPGAATARLYLKNLAKSVGVQQLRHLYDRYAYDHYGYDVTPQHIVADTEKYHVRVLQEGRMKGQGFVTLPSVALAERARRETNGYILSDKPMVVCFARARPT